MESEKRCRYCNTRLERVLLDLGEAPPSNSYLTQDDLLKPEARYPLKAMICDKCFLVQLDEPKKAREIFNADYAYYSSYSKSWLEHCRKFAHDIIPGLSLQTGDLVVEIASNDGYLLQYFRDHGMETLGIEPAAGTADVAIKRGIPTIVEYFGQELANRLRVEGIQAKLLIGNNVLAHVPDILDFVMGMKQVLHPEGTITMEFPHLLNLIEQTQFDTIYHEHFSYLSLGTVSSIFRHCGLIVHHVAEIPTHGGSLRIYAGHETSMKEPTQEFMRVIGKETESGLNRPEGYHLFAERAGKIRTDFTDFLQAQKLSGKQVVAYGAAAKGNTLLNFCGAGPQEIAFVADASPHKQGKFLPGSHIPVVSEAKIGETKPGYVVIFPWNLREEISTQLAYIRDWGGQFVVAVPELEIF